jgi:hypothetical protein
MLIILPIVLTGLFIIVGIFLLFGKGAWLIAGYNTAPKEEKAQINKKKLCRSMGVFMLAVSAAMAWMTYGIYQVETLMISEGAVLYYAAVLVAVIVIGLLVEIRYIKKHCYK